MHINEGIMCQTFNRSNKTEETKTVGETRYYVIKIGHTKQSKEKM